MNQENSDKYIEDSTYDEFVLIAVIKTILAGRKVILKIAAVFVLIGVFLAVFTMKEYTASTTIMPATKGKSIGGSLSGLAEMAGINLGGSTSESSVSPTLYPQIIGSVPFRKELLKTPLTFSGHQRQITYEDYYTNYYKDGVIDNIKKYTFGLPSVILEAIKGKQNSNINDASKVSDITTITTDEQALINQLSEQILLAVNIKEGYISIEVKMPEAIAAAQMAQKVQELLQQYIINFKVQKSSEQLKFIKERYNEKELEFKKVQQKLASFQDKNHYVNSQLAKMNLLRLQAEYDLSYDVYSELAKKMEAQQIQVKEDTPVFTVLEPVVVPHKKSKPSRVLILLMFTFIGFVAGAGYVFVKPFIKNIKEKLITEDSSVDMTLK